jgi:hypothetical protein
VAGGALLIRPNHQGRKLKETSDNYHTLYSKNLQNKSNRSIMNRNNELKQKLNIGLLMFLAAKYGFMSTIDAFEGY